MRTSGGKLALVLALAVMLSIPLVSQSAWGPPSGEDPVEPVTSEVTAYGFIANLSDQEENTPLQGVQVTLYDSDKSVVQVTSGTNPVKTDANGRFEFTFMHTEGDTYYMTFEYPGYTVRSLPDSMDMDSEGFVSFDPAETAVDSEGDYALSGESGGLHAIVMAVTTGSVYGTVQGESGGETFALSGATVTIVSEDGMSYSASTGANGYFSIDCPSGRYTMTVSCTGFQSSEAIAVESGHGSAYSVTLVQNTSEFVLGLDITHSIMVIGLVMLALIIVGVTAMHVRGRGRGDEPILMNDLEDLTQQQDEDEVRRP